MTYEFRMFACGDGDLTPGVVSLKTGGAVCWAAGRDDAERIENARLIALVLNSNSLPGQHVLLAAAVLAQVAA